MNDRDSKRDDERLRGFFRAVHADDRTPSFERLMRSRPAVTRARRWRPAVAVLAILVIALAVAWWMPRPGALGPGALTEEEQQALAAELSAFEGPLDFLLETPGHEVLYAPPRFGVSTFKIPPPAEAEENQP